MNRIVRFWGVIVAFLGTLLMSGRADMFVAFDCCIAVGGSEKGRFEKKKKRKKNKMEE